ncbi:EI24 domain-containing protein [Sphingomonas immobilis]|uniref:EI24 domain-containing protein n=1 Tax=Sphingomonas immobilis TaxID=3063997 RepID=A0ABT9A3P8_9SPHN|nr:EI24 domain-containing protein [Sphingomonas sp. CA1-15]MDO7844466.1 EI24 domain-containing protein [Sphingomonas sp. CA1-15]
MIRAFLLSIGQLGDPAFLRVLAKSLALTIVLLVALGGLTWFAAERIAVAWGASAGTGHLAGALAVLGAVAASWLLFRAVAIAVMSIFAEEIVVAVEAKHYPQALTAARHVGFGRSLALGLGSAARAILVNLVILPLYVVLLVTGVGTALLFFVVNGWLLGRDLGEMVAVRHVAPEAMRGWRRTSAGSRFVLGLAGTGLFMVPVVNLIAPVLGAAMATHLFHRKAAA